MSTESTLDSLLTEDRSFPPPPEFAARANANDPAVYAQAAADPEAYWAEWAERLHWFKPWERVLDWQPPYAKWFVGGTAERRVQLPGPPRGGRPGDQDGAAVGGRAGRQARLHLRRACTARCRKAANALKKMGVAKGDRVAIYLPMIPEAAIAMLACARIGARALRGLRRIQRGEPARPHPRRRGASVLITADGGYRRGGIVPLKRAADEALEEQGGCPTIEHVLVVRRHGSDGEAAGRRGDEGRPRPLVARRGGRRGRRLPGGGDGRRGPAVHPLHQRHDGQAQGDHAHHGRLPHPVPTPPPTWSSTSRTTTSTGARRTWAG